MVISETVAKWLPIGLILVWFVIRCINTPLRKRWIRNMEVIVLCVNTVASTVIGLKQMRQVYTFEIGVIAFTLAACCGALAITIASNWLET